MAALTVNRFSGMSPKTDARKLPDDGATVANWTRLEGTDIRAWRDPVTVEDLGSAGNNVTTLYRFTVYNPDGTLSTRRWLAWEGVPRVSPVPSPIPADALSRLYWTGQSGEGAGQEGQSGTMRVASSPTIGMTLGTTVGVRQVGIPQPIVRPAVVAVDDSAANSARPLEITNAKPAVVTFATPPNQPFVQSQQVQVVITTPDTAQQQNMRELSGKSFFVDSPTDSSITLRGSDTTNFTDFVDPNAATISAVFSEADFEDRAYVFTLVSDWGEEGPPSTPSDLVTVRKDGGKVTVTLTWARPAGFDHIVKARLYRTLTGSSNTSYFFVKDVALVGGSPSVPVIVEFVDDVPPEKIGEIMPSTSWTAPVKNMFGLMTMPNGFMVAFKGNTIYACEAYQPHAWPDAYRKTVDFDILGGAAMDQSAIVATSGKPYVLTGSDPLSLTARLLDIDAPCLDGSSIISVGAGVVYATRDGLALITPSAQIIITQNIFTKQQWNQLWVVGTYRPAYHDNRYIAVSSNPSLPSISFRIDPTDPDLQYFQMPALTGRAVAIDTSDDTLCYIASDGSTFRRLTRFDASLSLRTYTWTSKVFTMQAPVTFAVAQVFASSYPVTVQILAAKPVAGGAAGPMVDVRTVSVANSDPFRLPSGFTAREWQFSITGTVNFQRIDIASSIAELRAL